MSSKKLEVSVSPLFYDALSQEFSPGGDTRRHTMGRLAAATILKGEYERTQHKFAGSQELTADRAFFRYTPSWAPNTVCTVTADAVSDSHATMFGIHLYQSTHKRMVEVFSPRDKQTESLIIDHGLSFTEHELELGAKLFAAREAVAQAAEIFFATE